MSIHWTTAVWQQGETTGAARLLLLALADHADSRGVCWPSVARLARYTCLSERQVQRLLRRLEADGAIEVRRGGGRAYPSVYCLRTRAGVTPPDPAPCADSPLPDRPAGALPAPSAGAQTVTASAQRVTPGAQNGDTVVSPELSVIQLQQHPSPARAASSVDWACGPGPAPAPAAQPPTPQPTNPPAHRPFSPVTLYAGLMGRSASPLQARLIEQTIPALGASLDRWRATLAAWDQRGYNPANVAGLCDVFAHGFRSERRVSRSECRVQAGKPCRDARRSARAAPSSVLETHPSPPDAPPPLDPDLKRRLAAQRAQCAAIPAALPAAH